MVPQGLTDISPNDIPVSQEGFQRLVAKAPIVLTNITGFIEQFPQWKDALNANPHWVSSVSLHRSSDTSLQVEGVPSMPPLSLVQPESPGRVPSAAVGAPQIAAAPREKERSRHIQAAPVSEQRPNKAATDETVQMCSMLDKLIGAYGQAHKIAASDFDLPSKPSEEGLQDLQGKIEQCEMKIKKEKAMIKKSLKRIFRHCNESETSKKAAEIYGQRLARFQQAAQAKKKRKYEARIERINERKSDVEADMYVYSYLNKAQNASSS
jgi:hypothetical protein